MDHQDVLGMVAGGRAELRATFDLFDRDRTGGLTPDELRDGLELLGQPTDGDEAARLVRAADADGDGRLSFDEFLQLVEPLPAGLDPEADLRATFRILDRDGDGYVDVRELVGAAHGTMSVREARDLVRTADVDGDGRLSFPEFRALMAEAS